MTDKMKEAEALFWFHARRVGLSGKWQFDWIQKRVPFSTGAVCNHGQKKIRFQPTFVELNDKSHIEDTILHELAHALINPRHRHNKFWKRKAIELGCTGNRYYSKAVNNGK